MRANFPILLLAALIPLLTGFLWYSKMLFGSAWMRVNKLREEDMKGANMALVFGLTFVLGFFIAFATQFIVIHQWHIYSTVAHHMKELSDPASEVSRDVNGFMGKYGHEFRTFRHGALHGSMTGLFLITPVVGIIALFERRPFKYVAIHAGYWILTLALMGGVICQFS